MQDLLFVYGTLMRGYDHPMAKLLSRDADFLGEAQCRGRLYMIKHYPGLVLSEQATEVVHGELYRLHHPEELIATFDDYEGCGPTFEQPTAYLREALTVTLADGAGCETWTYVYNWPVDETKRIASGRFLAR